jgi:diguanylate cyclase (GGDEF)-like protein
MYFNFVSPIHWPIRLKVMLTVMGSQLLLGSILFFTVVERYDAALDTHVKSLQKEIDTLLSIEFIDPLLQRDFALAQQLADELVHQNAVTGIKLLGPTHKLVAQSGSTVDLQSLQKIDALHIYDWSKEQSIRKVTPLTFANQELGTVLYTVSLADQVNARTLFIKQFLLIALIVTLCTIALSFFISSRMIIRLKILRRMTDAAIGGNYAKRIKTVSNDEIGQLGVTFNRMASSIDERMQALIRAEVLKTSYLHSAQIEKARLGALLNSMRFGIVFLNNEQQIIYTNDALRNIWPKGVPAFVGQARNHGKETELEDGRIIFETSQLVLSEAGEGEEQPSDTDRAIGSLWIFEDVTLERNAQKTIQYLAERDSLTGLYNRRSFGLALQQAIDQRPDSRMALVYVDLDSFKLINDLHGHQQGDKVLVDIAGRLSACTRSTDIVARIGGDEFVVLIPDIEPQEQAIWCDRLLMQLTSHEGTNQQLGMTPTCSLGVAWYPQDGTSAEGLLAHADEAMYDAKRAGKNAWRSFQKHSDRDFEKVQTVLWSDRINTAIRKDGFRIFLQGVHHAQSREIHHFEALIRMPDPDNQGKMFSPGEFISHAEQSGRIIQLDRWMIKHCIKLLAEYPAIPPIAVNVSAVTFGDPSLVLYVEAQLKQNKVAGNRLHLELTETAALADVQSAQIAVAALQKLGCDICLDDFGSGFASLSYLKLIKADYLKIDGMFIKGILGDRENQVLLRAIVDIAKSSNRLTVAEWIEDEAMLETIKGFNVDLVQGYHLSRPEPCRTVITAYLSENVYVPSHPSVV